MQHDAHDTGLTHNSVRCHGLAMLQKAGLENIDLMAGIAQDGQFDIRALCFSTRMGVSKFGPNQRIAPDLLSGNLGTGHRGSDAGALCRRTFPSGKIVATGRQISSSSS
ncbi:MAG: hypothetical protein V7703_02800 [Hyphomicrobiales bacterium]